MGRLNLIFDLDGCLIDSTEVQKAAFFGSYAEVVGDDNCPTYEEYIRHTGDSVDNMLKKMGLPPEMAEPFRRISSESIDKVIVNWEVVDLIREMRKQGCKIAICTGKDHYRTEDILKYYGIDDLFDVLICADDVTEPKPSAMPALAAIEAMAVNRNTCVLIGDGYNDILCARKAGIRSILTLWYGDAGVPRKSDWTVQTVKELKEIFYLLNNYTSLQFYD